jgi:acyl-CoA synthetase (AMP-forming)/AMP-acid ligase II
MHEARLANWTCFGISREHRFLVSMPFTMHAGYSTATAYIRAGATVVLESRRELEEALVDYEIDHVILMPKQLRVVLARLPGDAARPRSLTISSLGAVLPATLRARALSRIAAEILDLYACNEVALVAVRGSESGAHGALWPGIEVEIVDERDHPLPAGEAGTVRIATDSMVEGYLDDPETTARMFRNGWFYPGDVGVLQGDRLLRVLGRADELLNVGGEKLSPVDLEEQIMAEAGIEDVGVCTVTDSEGVEQLCIAVSGAVTTDTNALARIGQLARAGRIESVFVLSIGQIPRTPTGKIQRGLLKSAANDAAKRARAI